MMIDKLKTAMELADAYAEKRHVCGDRTYNSTTAAARSALHQFLITAVTLAPLKVPTDDPGHFLDDPGRAMVANEVATPMQPIVRAANGVVRFKENRIVSAILEESRKAGYGLNEVACGDFTQEERMQFAQLIGYSVGGYSDLSYASPESVEKADAIAADMYAARPLKEGGK